VVRLVLFDIDGTLIRSGGAGVRAFERTFAEVFGLREATKKLKFAGRTDVSLVREGLTVHGLEANEENFRRFFESYPTFLAELLLTTKGAVCEGIHELIHQLEHAPEKPALGLLTGNIRRGAELKLRHYQLWHHFRTGAFADDHEDRNCIAAVAQKRGSELAGRTLSGEEIVVIGDTPHDITCGQSIGAKVLAVGTGEFGRAQLLECKPTWAVDHVGQIEVRTLLGRDG
jgi:phosphoglycolate phosphatase